MSSDLLTVVGVVVLFVATGIVLILNLALDKIRFERNWIRIFSPNGAPISQEEVNKILRIYAKQVARSNRPLAWEEKEITVYNFLRAVDTASYKGYKTVRDYGYYLVQP